LITTAAKCNCACTTDGSTGEPIAAAALALGWQARLALRLDASAGRTRLAQREHEGPLLVQRAFYPEAPIAGAQPCHLYIIHPPGGVASGDELQLDVQVGAGAHALLTTPAAAKFYRRGAAGLARVTQSLSAAGGVLEWLPQENIYYPDSAVQLRTIVRLSGAARFIGWEIGCLGLPASAQGIGNGSLQLALELWHEGRPLLLERLGLGRQVISARWGLAGHVALGTALAWPAGAADLERARAALEGSGGAHGDAEGAEICAGITIACTLVDDVLVCRAIAQRTDQLKGAFVRWWQVLRPALLGREAVLPRIWAT
jgi:urease accessory protein